MKFKFLFIIIVSPLFCFSQLDSIKGKVKSLNQTVTYANTFLIKGLLINREMNYKQYRLDYETIFDDFSKDLFPNRSSNYKKEYDEQGRLIKFSHCYFGDTIINISYYSYNEYNNLVQHKLLTKNGGFEVTNYYYLQQKDSLDHLVSEIQYETDPERFEMKQYYYNKKSQLIEEREFSQVRWDHKTNYQYDSAGRIIKELNFNIQKKLAVDNASGIEKIDDSLDIYYKKEYEYNVDGSLKLKIDGCAPYLVKMACIKSLFEYDDKKRLTKKTFYWGDSLFSHRGYQYNSDNTLKKIEWFYKEEPISKNFVEYFYKNKEITKAIFTDDGMSTVFEFKYKLDSHNNWIEQKKIVDGEIFYTRKRGITYWD